MKKKVLAILLSGTMAAGMLTGCGGDSSGAASDSAPAADAGDTADSSDTADAGAADTGDAAAVDEDAGDAAADTADSGDKPFAGQSITWTDTGAGDWDETLKPIVAAFEEQTGATVNVELYSHADYLEMLQVKLDAGSDDYDVIGIDVPLVASYAVKDWVAPMDEYFTAEEKDQFSPSALDAGTWDGVFYAPAMNSSSQLLWYNTALLEEAGVTVPESSTDNRLTWDQVADLARQTLDVVDPDGSKGIAGITFGQVSRTYQMNQLPNSMGGKNIGDDGYTAQGVINDDAWVESATWYQKLYEDGISLRGITADDAGDFFRAGKVIFIVDGTWMASTCDREGMANYGYAPVPAFKGHENEVGTPTGSWHFGIPKNAKNKELAAEFIKFMSIGEGNTMWLDSNGDVPATKVGAERIMDSADASEYMKIAAFESANTAVPRALTPGFTEYDTIIQNTWEDIKNGSDVKESLDNAADKIEKAMEKFK